MYLPEKFLERLRLLLGEDYENYLSGMETTYGQTLRLNRLKTSPADFFRRFIIAGENVPEMETVPWCENGLYYEGEERLSLHPYYYAGVYYLQEPSAMAPASFLPVEPGDHVLDLCAAPGGKTTALAAKLEGKGVIVANDISASRCKALLKNMELAGIRNGLVTCESPEKLAAHFPEYFDKILVDAPCSGEGMFRKEPAMAKDWTPELVEEYASIQKEILSSAVRMLKPGGKILYSTCTYSPEEDEQSVEYLLEQGFQLLDLPLYEGVAQGMPEHGRSGDPTLEKCRRFWCHRVKGEGQFAALLQKPGEKQEKEVSDKIAFQKIEEEILPVDKKAKKKAQKGQKGAKGKGRDGQSISKNGDSHDSEEMMAFFQDLPWKMEKERLLFLEERVFLLPEGLPTLRGIRQIRSGLYLGDVKKKRFEPSQALAMALKMEEYPNVLSLPQDDQRVERYLKGETIEGEVSDGWVLICVDDYPLGWGKSSRNSIKNKYYKGWRKS